MDSPPDTIPMTYLAGQLIGRLIACYALVWLGSLAVARGDWRQAFTRAHRPWGIVAMLVLFLLGLAGLVLRVAAGPALGG